MKTTPLDVLPDLSTTTASIQKLMEKIRVIEELFGEPNYETHFVAGGSVARAVGGLAPGEDVDLFVVGEERYNAFVVTATKSKTSWWDLLVQGDPGSGGTHTKFFYKGIHIDIVLAPANNAADTIAMFDIRASAVATDGKTLLSVEGAREDLVAKRLVMQRPGLVMRVKKYIEMGLLPAISALPLDVRNVKPGVPGWTLPENATLRQGLGLDPA